MIDKFIEKNFHLSLILEKQHKNVVYFNNPLNNFWKKIFKLKYEPKVFNMCFKINKKFKIIKYINKARLNEDDLLNLRKLNGGMIPEKKNIPFYYEAQNYETELISFASHILKPNDVFIDVGSNIGTININVAIHNPKVKIIAFEASKFTGKINKFFLEHLKIKNVKVFDCALGEKDQRGKLFQSPIESGRDSIKKIDDSTKYQEIEIKKLDSFNFNEVKLLKVDVEESEINVFRGADKLIKNSCPAIIFESTLNKGIKYKEPFQYLKKNGYRFFISGWTDKKNVWLNTTSNVPKKNLIFFELHKIEDREKLEFKTMNIFALQDIHLKNYF